MFSDEDVMLWHSNYGNASNGVPKPEVVAPSIWVAAPVLPLTKTAEEAKLLFERRGQGDAHIEDRLSELKLITPHYQHVDGTSFAAPLVASTVACMLEANPNLSPLLIRSILIETAHAVPGAEPARQGAGAIAPGQAVARALAERHQGKIAAGTSPDVSASGVVFSLHDHNTSHVEIFGSWNDWKGPGLAAQLAEPGFWQTRPADLPQGRHAYKFLLDHERWLDDPANPKKAPDGLGGLNSILYLPAPR
jgi:serine protease AprX